MNITFHSLYSIQDRFSFLNRRFYRTIRHLLFFLMLFFTGIFLFYKCHYGFGNIDESFYLVTPFRLIQGDALFRDEWHLSQMSGVLLMPFVSLYYRIMGNTEGIILSMRYVYTTIQLLIAVFLYIKLCPYHWLGAALAAISFALYAPFGIMALSYNSMGIMALVVSLIMLLTAQRFTSIQCILSGVIFSAAVLCCPYLAVLYIIYVLAAIMCRKKTHADSDLPWSMYRFSYFTLGVLISAALFVAFVLSRASIREIIAAFPHIFNDPEHPSISILEKIQTYIYGILRISALAKPIMLAFLFLFIVCILDKKRKSHSILYMISAVACAVFLLINIKKTNPYINYMMWPINLITPFILLLSTDKTIRHCFLCVYLPGMLYSFMLHVTSNQGELAIASGSSVATVASILVICIFCKELFVAHKTIFFRFIIIATLFALFIPQISYQTSLRYNSVFWENGMRAQTQLIDQGIYRGLLVSKEKEELCDLLEKQMEHVRKLASQNTKILYLSQSTWYYLFNDYEMASYSGWLSGVNMFTISRLEAYYKLNPDKYPDIVFVDSYNHSMAKEFSERFGYSIYQTEDCLLLFKSIS